MSDIVKRLRSPPDDPAALDLEAADEIERLRGENLALENEIEVLRFAGDVQGERLTAEIERLTRRLEGATRLLNAWHFEYHYGRRLEGIDDDTTTWLGGIDVPDRAADQPSSASGEGET